MGEWKSGYTCLEDKIQICAEYVYQVMGVGHLDQIYYNAFIFALEEQDVLYEKERVVNFEYHGRSVGYGKADLIVWTDDEREKIIIELKAVSEIKSDDKFHIIPFMKNLNINKGFVINFPQSKNSNDVEIHVETLS